MEIKLHRTTFTELSTIGKLEINDFGCYTLEDTDRGLDQNMTLDEIKETKVWGKTAIPTGRYKATITHSNRFNRLMPLLNDVSGFDGIRIHTGNTPENTDGCILVGLDKFANRITDSVKAFEQLFPILQNANEDIFITITRKEI